MLQPGINPLPIDIGRFSVERGRFPTADEMKRATGVMGTTGGMTNMGGFDPSDLMAAPKLRQDATMNQANMVSSPYFEANEKAAEKTNPMNAASQEPGKAFLMKYIGK